MASDDKCVIRLREGWCRHLASTFARASLVDAVEEDEATLKLQGRELAPEPGEERWTQPHFKGALLNAETEALEELGQLVAFLVGGDVIHGEIKRVPTGHGWMLAGSTGHCQSRPVFGVGRSHWHPNAPCELQGACELLEIYNSGVSVEL